VSAGVSSELTFGSGDFTIEAWHYPNSISINEQIIDWRPGSTDGKYPSLAVFSGQVQFGRDVSTTLNSTTLLTVNAWNHIAVAREGTNLRLFINGSLDASVTDSTVFLAPGASRPVLGAVGYNTAVFLMNGYLNSIAVYKGFAKYTASFTPPVARAGDVQIFGENAQIFDNVVPV